MNSRKTRAVARALTITLAIVLAWGWNQAPAAAAPTITVTGGGTAFVGQSMNVTGTVAPAGVYPAATEVRVGSTWSRSQLGTTNASGKVTLPLTYGKTTPGTYRFRLRVMVGGVATYSREFTLTRRSTRVLVLSAPSSAVSGTTANVKAKVENLGAGRRITSQFLVRGKWSNSRTVTTNGAGQATIPLTYGASTPGSYTWRLVSTNPYGVTSVTRSYKLTRTGSVEPVIPDAKYSVTRGPNVTNRVVLTFDDCPKSLTAFRQTVLAAEAADIGLALFPTGACMSSGRFDAAFARAHGMHVFNHSVSHPDLRGLSSAGIRRQLGSPGIVTTYGRPPYGAYNATVQAAYRSVGMRIWTWNVDTNDWRGKSQSAVVSYVVSHARAGNSVLMHMQWNGFSPSAIRAMKSGLNARGVQVCRNYIGTVPARPTGMWC